MAVAVKSSVIQQQATAKHTLLSIGELLLSLPQAEVVTIELVSTVIAFSREGSKAAGFIEYEGQEWPVYSLTPELHLRRYVPQKRRFCVCFGHDISQAFAILCDDVRLMPDTGEAHPEDLPPGMLTPKSPLRRLLLLNDSLVIMSDVAAMHEYLEHAHVDD